jgi:plasmid stabilization system protein ParE
MKIIVREKADADLDAIFAWIAKDNPAAAVAMIRRFELAEQRHAIDQAQLGPSRCQRRVIGNPQCSGARATQHAATPLAREERTGSRAICAPACRAAMRIS